MSEAKPAESYVLASIKRTGCYGKCPVYEAKVFSNGIVLYEGKQFSAREGIYEAYLTQNQIDSLLVQADSARFFDLQPLYPTDGAKLLDLPSTFTYLKKDKAEKEIINNHSAPKSLKYFEQYFDQLLLQLDWKPVEEVH
ncbi:MAG: hypothetical protein HC892_00950 [Saprospiraceae bacterium]|nr:hypothetical protein [Saprospiraceae bacterium]